MGGLGVPVELDAPAQPSGGNGHRRERQHHLRVERNPRAGAAGTQSTPPGSSFRQTPGRATRAMALAVRRQEDGGYGHQRDFHEVGALAP